MTAMEKMNEPGVEEMDWLLRATDFSSENHGLKMETLWQRFQEKAEQHRRVSLKDTDEEHELTDDELGWLAAAGRSEAILDGLNPKKP
jgi:hypothetical protein